MVCLKFLWLFQMIPAVLHAAQELLEYYEVEATLSIVMFDSVSTLLE